MFRFEYFLLSPHLESGGPQRGPVELIFLSVSLSGHLRRFLVTIKAWPINKRIACGRRPQVLQYILCRSTLSLYWVQKVPSGFQQILYVCLSVSLSGCTRRFLAIIRAARNYTQRMQPQATGSNTPSGSIVCLYVRLSGPPGASYNICICINFQYGDPES